MSKDDFMDLFNLDNFDKIDGLHTPTMQVWLENGCLMVALPDGNLVLNAQDTKLLTSFLSERVKLDPQPPADDFEDLQPKRVI